jgi:tetratricopeptide (TPR) repeat protein
MASDDAESSFETPDDGHAPFAKGDELIQQRKVDEAILAYSNALGDAPSYSQLWAVLTRASNRLFDEKAADILDAALHDAVAQHPERPVLHGLRSAFLLCQGDHVSDALAEANLALDASDGVTYITLRAAASAFLGPVDAALRWATALPEDERARALNDVGSVLSQSGHLEAALAVFSRAEEVGSHNLVAGSNVVRTLTLLGRLSEGQEKARTLPDADETAPVFARLADEISSTDKPAAADLYLRSVPFEVAGRNWWSIIPIVAAVGRLEDAVALTEEVPPAEKCSWCDAIGDEFKRLDRWTDAATWYRRATSYEPVEEYAYADLARALIRTEERDELDAVTATLEPTMRAGVSRAAGDELFAMQRRADAVHWYRLAADDDPYTHEGALARSLMRLGEFGEIPHIPEPTTDDERFAIAERMGTLAKAFEDFGHVQDAATWFRRAHEADSSESDYLSRLAGVLTRLNRADEALALAPEDDAVERLFVFKAVADRMMLDTRWQDALRVWRLARECDTADQDVLSGLARTLVRLGRVSEARSIVPRSNELTESALCSDLGDHFAEVGRWADALEYYKAAQRVDDTAAARVSVAGALRRLNRSAQAIDVLTSAMRDFPGEDGVECEYAECLWASRRYDEALARMRALAAREAYDISVLAGRLNELGRVSDALGVFEDESVDSFSASELNRRRGEFLERLGRTRDAEAAYRSALKLSPSNSTAAYALANLLTHSFGRGDAALGPCEVAMDGYNFVYAQIARSMALASAARWQEAEVGFQSLAATSHESDVLFFWGNALLDRNDFVGAEARFREAVSLYPGGWSARHNIAFSLEQQGRYREAMDEWDRVLVDYRCAWYGTTPTDPDVAMYLASVLSDRRELGEARAVVCEALRLEPSNVEFLGLAIDIEMACIDDGLVDDADGCQRVRQLCSVARRVFREQAPLDDPSPAERKQAFIVASACVAVGDLDDAEEIVSPILRYDSDGQLHSMMGVIASRRENHDRALALFQHAISLGRNSFTDRTNVGDALRAVGRLEDAETQYWLILNATRDQVDAQLGLAETYARLGDRDQDDEQYERAISHAEEALRRGTGARASRILSRQERAEARYLIGYACVKRQALGGLLANRTLQRARSEFDTAWKVSGQRLEKARRARDKIRHGNSAAREERVARIGTIVVLLFAFAAFVLAQIAFFKHAPIGDAYYVGLTCGALLFIVVGLYLPHILKLRVGSIELEKSAASEASAYTSLGIQR